MLPTLMSPDAGVTRQGLLSVKTFSMRECGIDGNVFAHAFLRYH